MKKMKKNLLASLISVSMVAAVFGTPVYAEETESIQAEETIQPEETVNTAKETVETAQISETFNKTEEVEAKSQNEQLETEENIAEETYEGTKARESESKVDETESVLEETEEVASDYFALKDEYVSNGFKYTEVAKGEVGVSGVDNITLSGVVTIPDKIQINNTTYTVTEVSFQAFKGCSGVSQFILPDTVTSIQYEAFAECTGLKQMILSKNINYVNQNAFRGCASLIIKTESAEVAQLLVDGEDYQPYVRYVLGDGQILDLNGNRWLNRGYERVGEALYYIISDKEVEVVDWKTKETQVTVPSTIMVNNHTYNVIGVADYAFDGHNSDNQNLKKVIFSDNLKYIGDNVFEFCRQLENVELPSTVESIGADVFMSTKLSSISIPEGVTELRGTFSECRELKEVRLPSGLKIIGERTFDSCDNLKKLVLPGSIENIERNAFYTDKWKWEDSPLNFFTDSYQVALLLAKYEGDRQISEECILDLDGNSWFGFTFEKDNYTFIKISETEVEIRKWNGNQEQLQIPAVVQNTDGKSYNVVSIGEKAFEAKETLKKVVISEGVSKIGKDAFDGCSNVTEISVPASVREVGYGAFWIGSYSHPYDNLIVKAASREAAQLVAEVSKGDKGMYDGQIRDFKGNVWHDLGLSIKSGDFIYSPLNEKEVKIVKWDGSNTVSVVEIPGRVQSYGKNYSVVCIDYSALSGNQSWTEVRVAEGIKEIRSGAFSNCNGLKKIILPSSIESMTDTSVSKTVIWQTDSKAVAQIVFNGGVDLKNIQDSKGNAWILEKPEEKPEDETITAGEYTLILNKDGTAVIKSWSGTDSQLTIPASMKASDGKVYTITAIGKNAFSNSTLRKVTISSGIKEIQTYAFNNSPLQTVIIQEGLTSIKDCGFYGCRELRYLTLPESLTYIGYKAFAYTNLSGRLNLPDQVSYIGDSSFGGCNIRSIQIPASIEHMGEVRGIFEVNEMIQYSCPYLTEIIMMGDAPKEVSKWFFASNEWLFEGLWGSPARPEGAELTISVPTGAKGYDVEPWSNHKVIYRDAPVPTPQKYVVKYNANGGSGAPTAQQKTEGKTLKLSASKPVKKYVLTYNANGGSVSNKTKSVSCTFKNWNTKADGKGTSYGAGENYTKDAPLTLYAQWSNPKAGTLAEPTRSGYNFDGWYTAANGGSKVTSGMTITKSMTLYAQWTKNKPQDPEVPQTEIEIFTTRLYKVCLGRTPDKAGLKTWADLLEAKEATGVSAAYGFVFSNEFKAKNLCNEDYVEQLYEAFMGRKADAAGKSTWVNLLESGTTREEVFNGFALSKEFEGLCNQYGIEQGKGIEIPKFGTIPTDSCTICGKEDGVTGFVTRLYQVCLNRKPDAGGLKDWRIRLCEHTSSGREVAYGFIFSQEFINKKYSNADYVEHLYEAFMGRGSDAAGKKMWVDLLNTGWTREQVFDGFVGSQEFTGICNSYGIVRD